MQVNHELSDKNLVKWKIDFNSLPGPDRSQIPYVHDVVRPASTKDLAAVAYSVIEWRMGWEGGYFALLSGPPDAPKTPWCPEGLQCMGYLNVMQWLDEDRYVVVNGYMYDGKKE